MLTFPRSQLLTIQWTVNSIHAMHDIHLPSPCQLNNTQCNFQRFSKPRVTPDSYHSTLSLRDNMSVCFNLGKYNSLAHTSSLFHFVIQLWVFIGRSPKDKLNPHSPRVVNDHTVHPSAMTPYPGVHHGQNLRDHSLIISTYQVNSLPTSQGRTSIHGLSEGLNL